MIAYENKKSNSFAPSIKKYLKKGFELFCFLASFMLRLYYEFRKEEKPKIEIVNSDLASRKIKNMKKIILKKLSLINLGFQNYLALFLVNSCLWVAKI